MKNMHDDEHSSVRDYSEWFSSIEILESKIHQLGGVEAIDFYEYVVRKLEECPENSDMLWLAAMQLENIPAVMLYKGNPDTAVKAERENVFANETSVGTQGNTLSPEDQKQIDSIVRALEMKRKTNPLKKLIKMIRA